MALTVNISADEIVRNALVTGEATPSQNKGLMAKLRQADDDNKAAVEAGETSFQAHDHTAAGMQLGSVLPESTAGTRADSFQDGAFTTAKIDDLAVDSAAIGDGEVYGAAIADLSLTTGNLGDADARTVTVQKGSNTTVNHGLGHYPMWHIENASGSPEYALGVVVVSVDTNSIVLTVGAAALTPESFTVDVVFR